MTYLIAVFVLTPQVSDEPGNLVFLAISKMVVLLVIVLALYAIHMVKPKLVTVIIYILIFLILVLAVFAAFHYSSLVMILKWVFTMLWLFYCLFLFSLHRNMMII